MGGAGMSRETIRTCSQSVVWAVKSALHPATLSYMSRDSAMPNLDDYSDEDCRSCKGTGMRLAQLTREQDHAYAQRGQPIPKVECWICEGTGFQPKPRT